LVIGALVCTDALDGTMARLTNTASKWGAFLDSTLDRVADAAVFAGLALFFVFRGQPWGAVAGVAALSLGQVVPYARARAEGLGFHAAIGLAERSDRLIVGLVAAAVVGLGADPLVLVIALAVLALASAITVGQRAAIVHRQWKAEQTGEKDVEPREGLA
jgi:CDP-diacylglycerol--glycerol-3-phosphate 3-phosphatidyltransferase